jgi:hypothetical protein
VELALALARGLADRVPDHQRAEPGVRHVRVEAADVGVGAGAVGEAVEDGDGAAVDGEAVEAQQAEVEEGRRRLAVEGAHGLVSQHAGLAAAGPSGGVEGEEGVEQRAYRVACRRVQARGAEALGPAEVVGVLGQARHGVVEVRGIVGEGQDGAGLGRVDARGPSRGRGGVEERRAGAQAFQVAAVEAVRAPAEVVQDGRGGLRLVSGCQERVEVVADPDAEREQLAAGRLRVDVERRQADQLVATAADGEGQQLALAEVAPPGEEPGRRLERRGVGGALPKVQPRGPQRVEPGPRRDLLDIETAHAAALGHPAPDGRAPSGGGQLLVGAQVGRDAAGGGEPRPGRLAAGLGVDLAGAPDRAGHPAASRTRKPVRPCSTTSARAPFGKAITGVPQARASIATSEPVSGARLGTSRQRAAERRRRLRGRPTGPRKRRPWSSRRVISSRK